MKIRDMTVEDIDLLRVQDANVAYRYKTFIEENIGRSWIVLTDDDIPIAAFGAFFIWEGVAEVWLNLINTKIKIGMIRIIKRYLAEKAKEYKIKRLQATVKADFEEGCRFIEWLGFKNETPRGMKHYYLDGSDAYLYARVYSWDNG